MPIVSTYPASSEARPPSFLGSQPCVPAPWLAERLLIAGDIESNPGPKPTLKTLLHELISPTPSNIPTRLSLVHSSPKTPTSIQPPPPQKTPTSSQSSPKLTPYTPDRIQLTRPDSPRIFPSHKLPYVALQKHPPQLLTSPHPHTPTNETNKRPPKQNTEIKILQLNANGIRSTVEELKHLMSTTQLDVVAIQESKLTPASRTPKIPHYTAIHTEKEHKQGGGLITYIKSGTTFGYIKTPQAINTDNTEIQLLKIHTKHLQGHHHSQHIHSTKKHHDTIDTTDTDITHCIQYITNLPNSIITGDVNAHSTLWHSYTDDHRSELISETLSNSNHITLNTDTPTRVPNNAHQQPTSPDITTISSSLYNRTTWTPIRALHSDHLLILLTD